MDLKEGKIKLNAFFCTLSEIENGVRAVQEYTHFTVDT